jgi:hypothetical protein
VGLDYHNRLIFRQDGWCLDPSPTGSNQSLCYDPSALAITSVFQRKTSGEILDADLEVNATNFTWGDFVGHPELFESDTHDFQGAVTHEFGHVIGLDHACFSPGGTFADGSLVPRPADNNGNPVPDCSPDNPPSITQTTMYVSVATPSAEVELRSLAPDDVQGACDIYPFTTNFVCLPPSGAGTDGGTAGGTTDGTTTTGTGTGEDAAWGAMGGTTTAASATGASSGGCSCRISGGQTMSYPGLALIALFIAARRLQKRH